MDEDLRTYLARGGSPPARLAARELDDDELSAKGRRLVETHVNVP